jgi:hypothetical protein
MSRVERTETPSDRHGSEHPREASRSRTSAPDTPTPTPTKAEGELGDVEQALKNQRE